MDDGVDFISYDTLSTFLRVFNECCLLATLQCGLFVCFGLSLLEVWKDGWMDGWVVVGVLIKEMGMNEWMNE